MPKINHEEYEVLKGLDDKWVWIARDEAQQMYAYEYRPIKSKLRGQWESSQDDYYPLTHDCLQFIQWEDEEPYSITELIEEYEKDYKGSWEHAIEFSKEMRRESEETEVKNLEWLKEEIKGYAYANYGNRMKIDISEEELDGLINQLDEPETLSKEWIREHLTDGHNAETGDAVVFVEDLQNLIVPKQEKVDQAYKDGYEKGKQHTFYKGYLEGLADKEKEPETVASIMADFFGAAARLREVLGMEVKDLEE